MQKLISYHHRTITGSGKPASPHRGDPTSPTQISLAGSGFRFVLYVREFQMQQDLPFSIGLHTLLFLFTGYTLPALCISSVCLSRLLFSCPQVWNPSILKGCMALCLCLFLTRLLVNPPIKLPLFLAIHSSSELPSSSCTPAFARLIIHTSHPFSN